MRRSILSKCVLIVPPGSVLTSWETLHISPLPQEGQNEAKHEDKLQALIGFSGAHVV